MLMFETYKRSVIKTSAANNFSWQEPIPVYLNEAEREIVATNGNLKGVDRDDNLCLARVLKEICL
jgi:hypothetical protein